MTLSGNTRYAIEDDSNELSSKPTMGACMKMVKQFIEMIKSAFPNFTV